MDYEKFEPFLNELNAAYQTIGILKSDIAAAKNNIIIAYSNKDLFNNIPTLEARIKQKEEMIGFQEKHIKTVVKQLDETV
jgi:hypothetical protein